MYSHLPGISASGDVVVALEDKFYALTQPLVSPPMSMTHFLFVVIAENGSYGVGHCVNYPGCVASQDLAHLQSTEEGGALERQCCCSPSTAQPKPWLLLPAAFQPPMQSTALPGLPWGKVTPFAVRLNTLRQHLGLLCKAVMHYF